MSHNLALWTISNVPPTTKQLYMKLLTKGVWTGVRQVGKSTFVEEDAKEQKDGVVNDRLKEKDCWNCGQKGHLSHDCH
jgi:hypothetical protein